jgi:deoxyhypusine synthase
MYKILIRRFEEYYEIDLKDSWMYAAAEKTYQLSVQDGKIVHGKYFCPMSLRRLKVSTMKSGIEYMVFLADWYPKNSANGVGFFQIGGGIAGDFQFVWFQCLPRYGNTFHLELFLPNFRFNYQLRFLFWSCSE